MATAGGGSERTSQRSEDPYRLIFERVPLPMWVYDPDTLAFLAVNDAAIERYGYSREEFLIMTIHDVHPPADRPRLERAIADPRPTSERGGEWLHIAKDGEVFDVEVVVEDLPPEEGRRGLVLARDISEQKRARATLCQRAAQQSAVAGLGVRALEGMEVSALMDEAADVVAATLGVELCEVLELGADRESLLLRAGVGWRPGLVREERIPSGSQFHAGFAFGSTGRVLVEDFAREKRFRPTPLLRDHRAVSGAAVIIGRTGRPYGVLGAHSTSPRPFTADEVDFLQSVANVLADALARHYTQEEILHQALHDALTGLPNRTLLMDRLTHWLGQARRRRARGAVFFVDLDGFKLVNDALGHDAGDQVLLTVSRRLSGVLRPTDTFARVGGDEFVIFCEDIADELAALELVERLFATLEEPFGVTGGGRKICASIGIALADHRSDAEILIRSADSAMYRAKERGGQRYELFDEEMRERSTKWLAIERELRQAVEGGELHNLYQPIVSVETEAIVGFEALVHWDHPARGLLSAGEFIPVAEQTGLIVAIGEGVIDRACDQAALWREAGAPELAMAVNLSPRQFSHPGLVPSVLAALERSRLDPAMLSLEITETVLIEDADTALHTLRRLKEVGVRLVLDDFGTGYSSLSHLKSFPIDLLKIDRSFVDGLGRNSSDSAIVSAVVSMGLAMGVDVVAEGVETRQQAAELRSLGCPLAQGYLYARPLTPQAAAALMDASAGLSTALREA